MKKGLEKVDLSGKTCLITGATSGIGLVTARRLLEMGAKVVIAGRNKFKLTGTVMDLRRHTENGEVSYLMVNLASRKSVLMLAQDFRDRHGQLDILINNAGTFSVNRKLTEDGIEYTFAVNYLSRFLLCNQLLDLLEKSACGRIIHVAGKYHSRGKIHFEDINLEKNYHWSTANNQSKLADLLFTYALARRLSGSNVTVNCLHPGGVDTGSVLRDPELPASLRLMYRVFRIFLKTPERGADTTVFLASSPDVSGESGKYWVNCKPMRSAAITYDFDLQEKFWELSLSLSGIGKWLGAEWEKVENGGMSGS